MFTRVTFILLLLTSVAYADEHVIRPTCWEENVGGVPQRHCQVNRPGNPAGAPPAAPQSGPPMAGQPPAGYYPSGQPESPPYGPPEGPGGPPFAPSYGYTSTLGPYGPRGGYYGPPPPYAYGPPPYYGQPWIPGPLAVFRFGPFGFVIP